MHDTGVVTTVLSGYYRWSRACVSVVGMAQAPRAARLTDAIRAWMEDAGITQQVLGERVATIEGRDGPYPQPTVATWLRRDDLLSDPQRRPSTLTWR